MSACCMPGFILGINSLVLMKTCQEVGTVAASISKAKQGASHLSEDTQLVGGMARLEPRQTPCGAPLPSCGWGLGYMPIPGWGRGKQANGAQSCRCLCRWP